MNSLPTITNNDIYLDVIRQVDPELLLIKIALEESRVNPALLPAIIRSIGNMELGTGFGKISIFMQQGMITQIQGEEWIKVDKQAVIDKSR